MGVIFLGFIEDCPSYGEIQSSCSGETLSLSESSLSKKFNGPVIAVSLTKKAVRFLVQSFLVFF